MQNNRTQSNILKELYNGVNKTELSSDFILPDSMPDARSVLHASCNYRKKDQQLKDGKLTYDIEAFYTVLYADENGDIRAVKYRDDTSDTVSVKGCDTNCQEITQPLPADTSVRLSNPRKFSIRCKCPIQTRIFGAYSDIPDIWELEDAEIQTVQIPSMQVRCGSEEGLTLSEDIEIPSDMPEPKELLDVKLSPRISELKSSDGKAILRGEISALVLYKTADHEIKLYERPIAFSQIIPVEGAADNSQCIGEIYIYDVTTDLASDTNGQMRIVEIDLLYDIRACCTYDQDAEMISDVYLLSRSSENEYKTLEINSSAGMYSANISVNEKTPAEGEVIEKMIVSTCLVENLKCEPNATGVTCTGDIIADCVVIKNGQPASLSCTFPFKASIDADNENCEYDIQAYCDKPKMRSDGESIYCDTEVYLTVSATKKSSQRIVSALSIGEDEPEETILPLTLYYPKKDDTVWNVAKKYRSTVADIISANSLTSTDISRCRVLVIPKIRTY